MRDSEELKPIADASASGTLGEVQRNRGGSAFELIAQRGAGGARQGGDHRGELNRDAINVGALMVDQDGFGDGRGRNGGRTLFFSSEGTGV